MLNVDDQGLSAGGPSSEKQSLVPATPHACSEPSCGRRSRDEEAELSPALSLFSAASGGRASKPITASRPQPQVSCDDRVCSSMPCSEEHPTGCGSRGDIVGHGSQPEAQIGGPPARQHNGGVSDHPGVASGDVDGRTAPPATRTEDLRPGDRSGDVGDCASKPVAIIPHVLPQRSETEYIKPKGRQQRRKLGQGTGGTVELRSLLSTG